MKQREYFQQWEGYGPDTPVRIYQWEAEFTRCLDLFRARAPESVLEVGTYHGGTLYHWLQNIETAPGFTARVVSVDSYAVGVDNRHLYEDWTPDGVELITLVGDSRNPEIRSAALQHGPYDWVFIDAGHFFHEVKSDWETFSLMVAPGGVCLLHDILPPSKEHPEIEVNRLWRALQLQGHVTQEIVADPHASWGGIGVVYL